MPELGSRQHIATVIHEVLKCVIFGSVTRAVPSHLCGEGSAKPGTDVLTFLVLYDFSFLSLTICIWT